MAAANELDHDALKSRVRMLIVDLDALHTDCVRAALAGQKADDVLQWARAIREASLRLAESIGIVMPFPAPTE